MLLILAEFLTFVALFRNYDYFLTNPLALWSTELWQSERLWLIRLESSWSELDEASSTSMSYFSAN